MVICALLFLGACSYTSGNGYDGTYGGGSYGSGGGYGYQNNGTRYTGGLFSGSTNGAYVGPNQRGGYYTYDSVCINPPCRSAPQSIGGTYGNPGGASARVQQHQVPPRSYSVGPDHYQNNGGGYRNQGNQVVRTPHHHHHHPHQPQAVPPQTSQPAQRYNRGGNRDGGGSRGGGYPNS